MSDPNPETAERVAFIHREFLLLGILIAVAVAAFLLTRAVATSNREMSERDAAEWYRRGQAQLDAQQLDPAIDSFRRATVRERNTKSYRLALARALTLKHEYDSARVELLTLRESAPEDPDINLQLARLAAERGDVTEALRFYRSALYAPWSADQLDARRRVRFELIRFLLQHDETSRAQAELLALEADLPDDVSLRLQTAQLFAAAGDSGHALAEFQRVIRLAPGHAEALAGAGQAAFERGDYSLARSYLRQTPMETDEIKRTRELVETVLSNDPLATRIGSSERRRRLIADVSYAQQRLRNCLTQDATRQATDEDQLLERQVQSFADEIGPMRLLEQDVLEAGVDLVGRAARYVTQRCGPATALDRALVLIGRQHGGDTH